MAIKDLLVAYDGNEASQHALEFAVQMAKKYQATVTGMTVSKPEPFESHLQRWIPDNVRESMVTARLEATKSIEAKFREQIAALGFGGDTQWLVEEGQPDLTLARSARFFDMLIIGQFLTAFKTEHRTVDPQELLQRAGKPIIIVPKGYKPRPFREEAAVALALPHAFAIDGDFEDAAGARHQRHLADVLAEGGEQFLRHPGRAQ